MAARAASRPAGGLPSARCAVGNPIIGERNAQSSVETRRALNKATGGYRGGGDARAR